MKIVSGLCWFSLLGIGVVLTSDSLWKTALLIWVVVAISIPAVVLGGRRRVVVVRPGPDQDGRALRD